MSELFSFQRYCNLFKWQMAKMQPLRFILISILVIMSSYLQTIFHYENMNSSSDKFILFVFILVICMNFFKQLKTGNVAGGFLLLPSSTTEKFAFLITSVVVFPMLFIVVLITGGDVLARIFHNVPATYTYMNFHAYLTVFFIASVSFFVHCLPLKGWTLGMSLVFFSFLIPIAIGYYKRKEVLVPIISEIWSAVNQTFYLMFFSAVVLFLAYVFFKRNEVSNFKVYE